MSDKMLDLSFYMDLPCPWDSFRPDHEVGDLQTYMQVMWELLTPERRKAFALNEQVHDTLDGALVFFEDDLEDFKR